MDTVGYDMYQKIINIQYTSKTNKIIRPEIQHNSQATA